MYSGGRLVGMRLDGFRLRACSQNLMAVRDGSTLPKQMCLMGDPVLLWLQ